MSAAKAAKQDLKAEILLLWDRDTWDQYNVTISHLFTRETRRLNKQIGIN